MGWSTGHLGQREDLLAPNRVELGLGGRGCTRRGCSSQGMGRAAAGVRDGRHRGLCVGSRRYGGERIRWREKMESIEKNKRGEKKEEKIKTKKR